MKLKTLSIAQMLSIGFGVILVVIMATSIFLTIEMRQTSTIEHVNTMSNEAIDQFDQAASRLNMARAQAIRFAMSGLQGDRDKIQPELDGFEQNIESVAMILKMAAPELMADLSRYRVAVQMYVEKTMQVEVSLAAAPATRGQAVQMILTGSAHQYVEASHESAKTARDRIAAWSASWSRRGDAAMAQMFWVTVASGLITLLLGMIMMRVISRSIGRSIDGVSIAMGKLAAGDLTVSIPGLGEPNEIGRMASAVQVFRESALEKRRLEAETVEKAHVVETERAQNEAQKTTGAAEQVRVVATIAEGLDQLAKGKLDHKIETPFPAGYERLRVDFNAATEKLLSNMLSVARNTSAISSSTQEIATASDDLSLRTEQQAASLEETAAALAQLTTMVNKTSSGARSAFELVLATKGQAEQSSEVVGRAVHAIKDIRQSSSQIGQIIGVIDEIAFQTNLLALNAGVEAARAGDSGRGFAVVASEVRALAQRCTEAAKEIKGLITASSGLVEQGVDLVGRTGQALSDITTSVAQITKVVSEISEAAREQATGLDEINKAIAQMDKVTQQNAAMVEESTAATHSLAGETADLVAVIQQFELGETRSQTAPIDLAAKRKTAISRPTQPALKKAVNASYAPQPSATDGDDWTEF